jgi:AraC-like DNA-binding protein
VQRLETDFAEDISLDELAALAQMSRNHCSDVSSTHWLYAASVSAAGAPEPRPENDWPAKPFVIIGEIAASTGFCDQAHLNRHFRRFFGTTPAAFRAHQAASKSQRATR